jgi:hypothetical protein
MNQKMTRRRFLTNGAEASYRNELITWDQLIRENKKLEVDYKGLVD